MTYNLQVGLVNAEQVEMVQGLEAHNSAELTKIRDDWENLTQNVHHLEAEVDASQTLVREVCAEREELRKMLDNKQSEISSEDQEVMNEMQMLLGEFETHNTEGGEVPQKSSFELLKQCAGVLEKNVERLAQRAEVGFPTKDPRCVLSGLRLLILAWFYSTSSNKTSWSNHFVSV